MKFKVSMSGYNQETDNDYFVSSKITVEQQIKLEEYYSSSTSKSLYFKAFTQEGEQVKLLIPDGLTIVMGPSNSGKSHITERMAQEFRCELIKAMEPEAPGLLTPDLALAKLGEFLSSESDVIIIDSLRYFAYDSRGKSAAVSGGVSASLFNDLSNLSLLCSLLRKKIVAVMNFVSETDSSRDLLVNAMIGSVSCVISTNTGLETRLGSYEDIAFLFQARTEQNRRRPILYKMYANTKKDEDQNKSLIVDIPDVKTKLWTVSMERDKKTEFIDKLLKEQRRNNE